MTKEIFKVGDKVYCLIHGWGEVYRIDESKDFSVRVNFKEDSDVGYDYNGRYYQESKPTLSFTEYTLQGFSQERPIELPKVGDLCLVRDYKDDTWLAREFAEYRHGLFICQAVHGQGEVEWKYMKRIKILD